MNKEKKKDNWFQKNKQKLMIAGAGIAIITLAAIGFKHFKRSERDLLNPLSEAPNRLIEPPTQLSESRIHRLPHPVSMHTRTLPIGHQASAQKLCEAAELGIDLLPGQTWVRDYTTKGAAA